MAPGGQGGSANQACLTAGTNTTQLPAPGCVATPDAEGAGFLRFTDATNGVKGGALSTSSIPTLHGLEISFNFYHWGSNTAAGGIAFVFARSTRAAPRRPHS